MTNKVIAETTMKYLGGAGRLTAMIGAKNFTCDEKGTLTFTFSGCKKINQVSFELNGLDLYDVRFIKYTAGRMNNKTFEYKMPSWETVKELNNVYAEDLKEIFEDVTGLYLSL